MLVFNERNENGFAKIFPQKLMELLSHDCISESITWMPKGDAFMIVKESLFAEEILPRFCKKTPKLSSFKGKLNRWGFRRILRGEYKGAYFHKLFIRDNPVLCLYMRRNQRKIHDFSCETALVEEKVPLEKRSPITENSNSRSSDQARIIAPQVYKHEKEEPIPTGTNLQNPLFSPVSPVTCSGYYNQVLLRTYLVRTLLSNEIALRVQMQAQSLGKRQERNALLATENHTLGIFRPTKNFSFSQGISSSSDKKYLAALTRF